MKAKIKTISKGWGEGSTYFTTDERAKGATHYADEIKEEIKDIGPGLITVYRGYIGGNIAFEIGASIDITLTFYSSPIENKD